MILSLVNHIENLATVFSGASVLSVTRNAPGFPLNTITLIEKQSHRPDELAMKLTMFYKKSDFSGYKLIHHEGVEHFFAKK